MLSFGQGRGPGEPPGHAIHPATGGDPGRLPGHQLTHPALLALRLVCVAVGQLPLLSLAVMNLLLAVLLLDPSWSWVTPHSLRGTLPRLSFRSGAPSSGWIGENGDVALVTAGGLVERPAAGDEDESGCAVNAEDRGRQAL